MKSRKNPRVSPRRKSTFQMASRAPAARAATNSARSAGSRSVRKGSTGMAKSRAGTPAADSSLMAPRRRSGRGARGSIRRRSAASSDVSETLTMSSPAAAISRSRSMSRVTAGDLVVIPTRRPGTRSKLSSTRRVTRNRDSAGWYGSVAAPMATSSPLSRARLSLERSFASSACFT